MRLVEIVERFLTRTREQPLQVAVLGDAMLDEYWPVEADRVAPEAPVPVLRSSRAAPVVRPGGAANVAHQMSHLNATPSLIAPLDSRSGTDLAPLDVWLCPLAPWAVPRKRRYVQGGQVLVRHDIEQAAENQRCAPEVRDQLSRNLEGLLGLRNIDAVILSDYAKGALDQSLIRKVIDACRDARIPVLVDPKRRPLAHWRGCTVLKLNGAEADGLDARRVLEEVDCEAVVTTHADRAPEATTAEGSFPLPAGPAVPARSVSGAGDCFLAWLAAALCRGFGHAEAATLAHLAGKVYVGKGQNEPVHPWEILRLVDPVAAKLAPPPFRPAGKVVFTNGCFDLLHGGHVRTLQWAKDQGDWLTVGLNTDGSVRRLKGPGRPVLPQQERALLLASLACVDEVILFEEDTPLTLLGRVKPDLLVKGPDYAFPCVVGADLVGEVAIAPSFGIDFHTSDLIHRIRAS